MTAEEFEKRMDAMEEQLREMEIDSKPKQFGQAKGTLWLLIHDTRFDMQEHFRQHEPPCGDAYEKPLRVRSGVRAEELAECNGAAALKDHCGACVVSAAQASGEEIAESMLAGRGE